MRFVVGADEHDELLRIIEGELRRLGHDVLLVGATPDAPAPWGKVAIEVGHRVAEGQADYGVLCCYTGTGVAMAANKVAGVRAALCVDAETARGARQWNDANVLALSLRLTSPTLAREILRAWCAAAYGASEEESLAVIRDTEASALTKKS